MIFFLQFIVLCSLFFPLNSTSAIYYVTSNSTASCSIFSECGSFSSPFTSILDLFYYIDSTAAQINTNFSDISVILMNDYYIIDPFNVSFYLNSLNALYNKNNLFWTVFEDIRNINIAIYSYKQTEMATISFRTLKIGFQINDCTFFLDKIILDFLQIDYSLNYALDCLFWKEGCCKYKEEQISDTDPCFVYHIMPYTVNTYFNFIEIHHHSIAMINFLDCEINNLNLPKRYLDFFIASFLYETSEFILFNFINTKIQNISINENYFIGSNLFISHFIIHKPKYFNFFFSTLDYTGFQEGETMFSLHNYEIISFLNSNITNVLRLAIFNPVKYLYLANSIFVAFPNNIPFSTAFFIKDYISSNIYEFYLDESAFFGAFYNHYILNNEGNVYIKDTNFTGLVLNSNPFFLLKYITILNITNMIIEFEHVRFSDQNVFAFTSLDTMFINGLQIFNYGEMPLTFFTLYSIFSVCLDKVLVNTKTKREHQFVLLHFRSLQLPIRILNSILFKTSLFFDGIDTIYVTFSNFSTEDDINTPIFSFLEFNKIYVLSCTFTHIFYKKSGSIFSLGNQNDLLIYYSSFSLSQNFEGGNVLFALSGNYIKIQASNFRDIFSFDKGGAFLLNENNFLIIKNSKIENISAINSGGFLFASQTTNFIWIATSIVSNVFSAEGGFILLNYKSFLYISKTYIKSAGVSYLGGAFSLRTSNEAVILNCTFEMLISEEAAGFFSLIESNKLISSNLKVNYIKSYGNVGNIYLRSKNEIILRNCEIISIDSNLIYLNTNNSVIFMQFKIYNANDILFNLNQYNVISLNKVTIMNYLSSKELFSAVNKNIIFIYDTEIKEEISSNIGWVFNIVASNTIKLEKTNFTFLKLIGIIALDQNSQIFINQTKFKLGKVTKNLIQVVNSKILVHQTSFNNEMQGNLSLNDFEEIPYITLFLIRNSSLYLYKSSFNAIKGQQNFRFGDSVTSNIYVDNSKFQNDKGLGKISDFLTCKFSALIIRKCSFFFSNINSKDTKIIILKSEFHLNWNIGFYINITDKKYEILFTTLISNSFFLKHDGGVFNFFSDRENYQSQMKIYKCFFAFNSAEKGSVLMGYNLIFFNFTNNRAYANKCKRRQSKLSKGGVFYFFGNFSSFNYSYHIYKSNNFISNQADAGGVFFLQTGFPFLSQNEVFLNNNFTKNLAYYYGNEITSCTITLGLEENITKINIPNLVSGHIYPTCLASLSSFDYYSQRTTNNDDEYVHMLKGVGMGGYEINLSENWNIYEGGMCFGGYLKNLYPPNSKIYWNNITFNYLNLTSSTVYLSYNFRKCMRGEKMTDDFQCSKCVRNFFSFTSNIDYFSNCLMCNEQLGFFCFGGSQLTIKKGFWRKNKDSTNILACLNREACLGDERIFDDTSEYLEEYSVSKCKEGYVNPLCAVCKAGWSLNSSFVCSVCGSYDYLLKSLCLTLIQLFFLAFTVHQSYKISKELYRDSLEIKNIISMELLKLFSFHAQLLIVIFSVKGSIINIRSIFEVNPFNSNISDNLSLQCLAQAGNIYLPYYYSKLVVSLNTPFLIFIISLIFIAILIKRNIGINRIIIEKIGFFSTLKTLLFVTLSLQTSNILRDCLDGLIYVNIADPELEPDLHLLSDPSISYLSQEFQLIKNLVIIPVIFFLGIFFPIFIFWKQYQNYKFGHLENKKNLFSYGYFFYSYEDNKFYWDLVVSFRKLLILIIISFSKDVQFQTEEGDLLSFCIVSLFLAIILFTLNKIKPYKEELQIVHKAEEFSLFVLLLSTIVLLPSLTNQNQASDYDRIKTLVPSFIIYSINAGFYLIFVSEYIKSMNLKNKLMKYLPKSVQNTKFFTKILTQLTSVVLSSKNSLFSSKKKSFKYKSQKSKNTSNRKRSNMASDSIDYFKKNENLEVEKFKNKITSWDRETKEVGIFLKSAARKKELFLQKMQKMALKNLHQSKDELEYSNSDSKFKTQIICFEEGIKGILFKDEEVEIKLIYWRTDEIVNYKIKILSFEDVFILNSRELILNDGRESKNYLQNNGEKTCREIIFFSLGINKKFSQLPILRLDLWMKKKKAILDLVLPLPFLYYVPFTSSSKFMLVEDESKLFSNLKEIFFTTSSSFIRRIAILHRIYEFKYRNLFNLCEFIFLTKEGNKIMFYWSPIFGKKIGKITIHFEKGDWKLVEMIRKMMEIKK